MSLNNAIKHQIALLTIGFSLVLSVQSCHTKLLVNKVETANNKSIGSDLQEDERAVTMITPYKQKLDEQMNTVLSQSDVSWSKVGNNSNLGILLSDFTKSAAQKWADKNGNFHVDAAILNAGGIRSSLPKGKIKVMNVFEVMPFDNELVIVKMPSEAMEKIWAYYLKYKKNNPVSGLSIAIKDNQLVETLIEGKEPENNRFYYIATSDYLVSGGDNMDFFSKGQAIKTNLKLRDIFLDEMKSQKKLIEKKEIRLIFDHADNE